MNSLPKAILCDIDGTIALRGDRDPHDLSNVVEDAPNRDLLPLLHVLSKVYTIVYVSGREDWCRPATEYWLQTHGWPHGPLLMRRTGDNRPDNEAKEELYDHFILPSFAPVAVFDDRNRVVAMWRRRGLLCLQVADGDF